MWNQFQKSDLIYARKLPSEYLSHCTFLPLILSVRIFVPETPGKREETAEEAKSEFYIMDREKEKYSSTVSACDSLTCLLITYCVRSTGKL
jgi:hypothetical protein